MKTFLHLITVLALMMLALSSGRPALAQSNLWITAYYAGWQQGYNNSGNLPAQEIDYSAVTQLNHFALLPKPDGTLDDSANSVTLANGRALIARAHAAGKKVLITIGGWGSNTLFRNVTGVLMLPLFVQNLVRFMQSQGYDGIDIDWETIDPQDILPYTLFITTLRMQLNLIQPRPLLTASIDWQPALFASLASDFDQINLMTYDLSGAWPGWVSWHNAPITDGGFRFPSTGRPPPSIDAAVDSFAAAGIPLKKIGIGIDFYGYIWSGGSGTPTGGVTAPRQSWITPPLVRNNVPFSVIMSKIYRPEVYVWDSGPQAAYLSIDHPGSAQDTFVTYDNEQSCKQKIEYARKKGIGGVIIWELGGAYRPNLPPGERDRLLQVVKQTYLDYTPPTPRPIFNVATPVSGDSVSGVVPVAIAPEDSTHYLAVQVRVNGKPVSPPLVTPPYVFILNTQSMAPGTDSITVTAQDIAGDSSAASIVVIVPQTRTSRDSIATLPTATILLQNYPNPFNRSTDINYSLPNDASISLTIYNGLGERVGKLLNGVEHSGFHHYLYTPSDKLPSGIYYYRLIGYSVSADNTPPFIITKKLMYLK
ncbi:MAG TPA: glycosyl hydrolase family 18 protein [Bacteroidota bacterium]|nr:glycosyl hydrolase family 18 protein [Bacteroidota bacterium]